MRDVCGGTLSLAAVEVRVVLEKKTGKISLIKMQSPDEVKTNCVTWFEETKNPGLSG